MTTNLRIPGPTSCPEETLSALSQQMINHRGPEFAAMQTRIMSKLQEVFRTQNEVFVYTTSGTGVMEASIVNTLSAGDKVIVAGIGEFGDRYAAIARVYGVEVTKLDFDPGTPADAAQIAEALAKDPEIKAVLVTHNETSTGVTNDIAAIGQAIRAVNPEILYLVDAISSLGCVPFQMDTWGIDVATTCSQKGFMIPPGLAFLSMSPRAWKAYETSTLPRFYLDAKKYKEFADKGQPPFTPAMSMYYGLDTALEMLASEGFEQVYARHAAIGEYTRQKARDLGLEMLAKGPEASNTVTSIRMPEGINATEVLKTLITEYDTVLAAGQGKLAGKIVRVGHMGIVEESDIDAAMAALEAAMEKQGYKKPAAVGGD